MKNIITPIFKSGIQTSSGGKTKYYSIKDLDSIVEAFNIDIHEPPLLIGHNEATSPAFGWVKRIWRSGSDLMAEFELTPIVKKILDMKLFKKVSTSFYPPDSPHNPTPGKRNIRHVALVDVPAVKGLPDIQDAMGAAYSFSDGENDSEIFQFETEYPCNIPPDWQCL